MPVEREMLRLSLSPQVVTDAKVAAAKHATVIRNGKAEFREMLDLAAKDFLKIVEENLIAAGFHSQLSWGYRTWPCSKTTMAEIRAVADRRGVSCASIVRALLILMSRTRPPAIPKPAPRDPESQESVAGDAPTKNLDEVDAIAAGIVRAVFAKEKQAEVVGVAHGAIPQNPCFGNERDYHKYNLLLDLVCGFQQLTNIMMLAPSSDSGKVRKRDHDYAQGERRADVYNFLRSPGRNVADLKELFAGRSFNYNHYDRPFQEDSREAYFSSIPTEWLSNALVFCDPKVGLKQNNKRASTEHLYFSEAAALWNRMKDSCLVIYQQLARNTSKREQQAAEKAEQLQKELHVPVSVVRSLDVAFLIAGAKPKV